MVENNFTVVQKNVQNLMEIKEQYQVPRELQACHTAIVDGYVIEGHVPATDVQRLLKERPDIKGLAVKGMPLGSPGMDSSDAAANPFEVYTFNDLGETAVFASYP
jgi:hypothetical protein